MAVKKERDDTHMIALNISATHSQHLQHALPSTTKTQHTNGTSVEMRPQGSCCSKLFKGFFYFNCSLITVLVIVLAIRGFTSTTKFQPRKWFPPTLASIPCAGTIGLTWQAFARCSPSRTIRAAFYLGPLLTLAVGILFISIGTPGSPAVAAFALVSAVLQSLYACWINPQIKHTVQILRVSIAYSPPKVTIILILSVIFSTLYSSFLIIGIGGATATRHRIDAFFIFLIIINLAWTMHIIKNALQVTVSHIKYMQFAYGIEVEFKTVFKNTMRYSMGSICIGSILVPILGVIRAFARAISLASGDVDEFMFSCANCCSGVASRLVAYGNRWGFVHVGVYNIGIVQASKDTWEMFRSSGLEKLIISDLTSSFCFLAGVSTGASCALVAGGWAFLAHKSYAVEVSVYSFLIGYFLTRVAVSWIQASISAYYVAYAENPQSQQFDNTIPDYIRQLQRSQL